MLEWKRDTFAKRRLIERVSKVIVVTELYSCDYIYSHYVLLSRQAENTIYFFGKDTGKNSIEDCTFKNSQLHFKRKSLQKPVYLATKFRIFPFHYTKN